MDRLPHQANLRKGRYSQPLGLYFVTKCLKAGETLSPGQRSVIVSVIMLFQERKWLFLQAFVIMPDHLHLLFTLGEEKTLSIMIRELCRNANYTDRTHEKPIDWQKGYFDHKVRSGESIVEILRYIEGNPVRKKLAVTETEWIWSSANPLYNFEKNRFLLGHERWA